MSHRSEESDYGNSSQLQPSGTGHVTFSSVFCSDIIGVRDFSRPVKVKIQCISFMKEYESKSLEELRVEDYKAGRKKKNIFHHYFKHTNTNKGLESSDKTDVCEAGPSHGIFLFHNKTSQACIFCNFYTCSICVFCKDKVKEQQTPGTGHVNYSHVLSWDSVVEADWTQRVRVKLQCITCMTEYQSKSLEELRLEDYAAERKGNSDTKPSLYANLSGPTISDAIFASVPDAIFALVPGIKSMLSANKLPVPSLNSILPSSESTVPSFNCKPITTESSVQSFNSTLTTSQSLVSISNSTSTSSESPVPSLNCKPITTESSFQSINSTLTTSQSLVSSPNPTSASRESPVPSLNCKPITTESSVQSINSTLTTGQSLVSSPNSTTLSSESPVSSLNSTLTLSQSPVPIHNSTSTSSESSDPSVNSTPILSQSSVLRQNSALKPNQCPFSDLITVQIMEKQNVNDTQSMGSVNDT